MMRWTPRAQRIADRLLCECARDGWPVLTANYCEVFYIRERGVYKRVLRAAAEIVLTRVAREHGILRDRDGGKASGDESEYAVVIIPDDDDDDDPMPRIEDVIGDYAVEKMLDDDDDDTSTWRKTLAHVLAASSPLPYLRMAPMNPDDELSCIVPIFLPPTLWPGTITDAMIEMENTSSGRVGVVRRLPRVSRRYDTPCQTKTVPKFAFALLERTRYLSVLDTCTLASSATTMQFMFEGARTRQGRACRCLCRLIAYIAANANPRRLTPRALSPRTARETVSTRVAIAPERTGEVATVIPLGYEARVLARASSGLSMVYTDNM